VLVVASNRETLYLGTIVDEGEGSRGKGECCKELHHMNLIVNETEATVELQ
jgi:hypothetical protein